MARFIITSKSITQKAGKTFLHVTFIDEVNGKADKSCNHEIESVDAQVINEQLALAAIEYESRVEVEEAPSVIGLEMNAGVEVDAVAEISEIASARADAFAIGMDAMKE